MKIAYVLHAGDTNGGFPQHAETIILTFKELGHEVEFFLLKYQEKPSSSLRNKLEELNSTNGIYIKDKKEHQFDKGVGTGLWFEPETGWVTEGYSYKTLEQKKQFRDKMEDFDAVFWHTPFWFKQNATLKDTDWPIMLDAKNPVQIGMVHDANLRSNTAWLHFIEEKFDYILTVHPASYNSASVLRTPRVMIFNPQDLSEVNSNVSGFNDRGLFILQNWKASKRGVDFVRSVPYLENDYNIFVGGGGIEWRYLCATDKCKPQYFSSASIDPDRKDLWGNRAIDNARKYKGWKEVGWITENERDSLFKESKFFIDPAWYRVNKELGAHFSRTLVEAMKFGVVPIARGLGLSNSEEGKGDVFTSGENYINIPSTSTPEEFAAAIDRSDSMSEENYEKIVRNNYNLLEHFDRFHVVEEYIKLINHEPCGWYNKFETGEPTPKFLNKARKQWFGTGDSRTFSFPSTIVRKSLF